MAMADLPTVYGVFDDDLTFDAAQALHWFCADYHDGQSSDLYRILSILEYKPGMCEGEPEEESVAADIYHMLEDGELDPWDVFGWIEEHLVNE